MGTNLHAAYYSNIRSPYCSNTPFRYLVSFAACNSNHNIYLDNTFWGQGIDNRATTVIYNEWHWCQASCHCDSVRVISVCVIVRRLSYCHIICTQSQFSDDQSEALLSSCYSLLHDVWKLQYDGHSILISSLLSRQSWTCNIIQEHFKILKGQKRK